MDIKETLETFAKNFVLPEFRERFVHEAIKKPRKLHSRICHQMREVFPSQYQDNSVSFSPDGPCLLIGWASKIEHLTWSEAAKKVGLGGILVIDVSGQKFYAETEGEPRIHTWGGLTHHSSRTPNGAP